MKSKYITFEMQLENEIWEQCGFFISMDFE